MNRTEFINLLIAKEKESLEKFKDYCLEYPDDDTFPKCVKSIENRIKNLEEIKDILEAWEICKKKSVDIEKLKLSTCLEEYNSCRYEDVRLTDEEFEILKNRDDL